MDFLNTSLGILVSILTLIGVIGVASISIVRKNKQKLTGNGIANNSEGDTANLSGGSQTGALNIVGNNNTIYKATQEGPVGNEQANEIVDLKSISQILFIDDEKLPTVIKTLRKAGWKNIRRIGDTANLDLADIQIANIIFVDIKGVGKELGFKNEGMGLAAALKDKYPAKGVVIYSATPEHNLFDPDIDKVDGRLFKNAEPIQFSNMIEQYGKPKN